VKLPVVLPSDDEYNDLRFTESVSLFEVICMNVRGIVGKSPPKLSWENAIGGWPLAATVAGISNEPAIYEYLPTKPDFLFTKRRATV